MLRARQDLSHPNDDHTPRPTSCTRWLCVADVASGAGPTEVVDLHGEGTPTSDPPGRQPGAPTAHLRGAAPAPPPPRRASPAVLGRRLRSALGQPSPSGQGVREPPRRLRFPPGAPGCREHAGDPLGTRWGRAGANARARGLTGRVGQVDTQEPRDGAWRSWSPDHFEERRTPAVWHPVGADLTPAEGVEETAGTAPALPPLLLPRLRSAPTQTRSTPRE